MSGTNFPNGVATRKQYSGTTSATDLSYMNATTKFIRRHAVIRCTAAAAETTSNFTFPDVCIVHDVFLNVITADTGETVDVGTAGTSNDPDGFLDGASVNATGLVYGSLADGAVTRGALLNEITEATTAAARMPDITVGGDPLTFTGSAAGAVFDIIVDYTEVVTELSGA